MRWSWSIRMRTATGLRVLLNEGRAIFGLGFGRKRHQLALIARWAEV